MKTFLAIISKQNEISPYTFDKINNIASRSLACVPGDYTMESWKSPSNRVILCSFYNEPLLDASCSLWSRESSAFTITGYINDDLNQLSDTILNKCPDEAARQKAISKTSGLYSACFADGDKDSITVWNTITRIEPVYWTENGEHIIVSTRALLAHLLSIESKAPSYDIMNLGYFINSGYYNSECTPYKGVKVLGPNSVMKVDSLGVKVRHVDGLEEEELLIKPDAALYDDLTDAFVESLLPLKRHNIKINADLTGGKDSRLIAAALKYIDADFQANTSGFPEHPDVQVAGMVARALGISHNVNTPRVQKDDSEEYLTVDILKRTRDSLFITDGMVSAYENTTRRSQFLSDKIILGGNGGELLRGGYASGMKDYDMKHIKELCFNKFFYYAAFLRDEPLKVYTDALNNWIDAQPHWLSPCDLGAVYYLHYRCGRWSASERAGATEWHYLYQPFFDSRLVNIIQQVHCDYRMNEELAYNLLKRLAPGLIDIPFYKNRWRFEANGPRPGDEDSWIKRSPINDVLNPKSTFNWRTTCLLDMKDLFFDQIFNSQASEAVFQIVRREKVQQLFDSPDQLYYRSSNYELLWNIYSASVLLSNDWLNDTGGNRIVKIKIPS